MSTANKPPSANIKCDCPYCDSEPSALGKLYDFCSRCSVVLKRCKSCGQPVSTLTIKCPHCGKPA